MGLRRLIQNCSDEKKSRDYKLKGHENLSLNFVRILGIFVFCSESEISSKLLKIINEIIREGHVN